MQLISAFKRAYEALENSWGRGFFYIKPAGKRPLVKPQAVPGRMIESFMVFSELFGLCSPSVENI